MNIQPSTNAPLAQLKGAAVQSHPQEPLRQPAVAVAQPQPVAAKVKLQAPEKVDLGFSAQEMRINIQEAIDRLNQQIKENGRDLTFQMDEKIDRPIITVRNLQTGEVVRQIPTEEVVQMAHSIEDIKGLLFNKML
jgi:flagellar protein FlaG